MPGTFTGMETQLNGMTSRDIEAEKARQDRERRVVIRKIKAYAKKHPDGCLAVEVELRDALGLEVV